MSGQNSLMAAEAMAHFGALLATQVTAPNAIGSKADLGHATLCQRVFGTYP